MHKRAYQHRVCKAVEFMIADALLAAKDHVTVAGSDGREVSLADCAADMEGYWRLGEYLLRVIEHSTGQVTRTCCAILAVCGTEMLIKIALAVT